MNAPRTEAAIDTLPVDGSYCLVSIAKAAAPFGPDDRDWHRYVISQGDNQIVGHRSGTPAEARKAVEDLILQLNARRIVKPSRVHLTLNKKT